MEDNTIEAFPLQWPAGFNRTAKEDRKYSQFQCTVAQARDGVLTEINRLNGINPIISSNVPVKRDGQMYATTKPVDGDTGVAVYFTWDNQQYVLACDQYLYLQDNLRAIEKSIDALRGLKRWGASDILKRAFSGFKMLASGPAWYEILDVREDAHHNEVKDAHRLLVKKFHPDNKATGDINEFQRIQSAWEQYQATH